MGKKTPRATIFWWFCPPLRSPEAGSIRYFAPGNFDWAVRAGIEPVKSALTAGLLLALGSLGALAQDVVHLEVSRHAVLPEAARPETVPADAPQPDATPADT